MGLSSLIRQLPSGPNVATAVPAGTGAKIYCADGDAAAGVNFSLTVNATVNIQVVWTDASSTAQWELDGRTASDPVVPGMSGDAAIVTATTLTAGSHTVTASATSGQVMIVVIVGADTGDNCVTAAPVAPTGYSFGEGASGSATWGGLGLPDVAVNEYVVAAIRSSESSSFAVAGHGASLVWNDGGNPLPSRWYYFMAFQGPITSSDVVSWGSEVVFVVVVGGGSVASTGTEIVAPDGYSDTDFSHTFTNAVVACLGPFIETGSFTELGSGSSLDVAVATGPIGMYGAAVAWAEII